LTASVALTLGSAPFQSLNTALLRLHLLQIGRRVKHLPPLTLLGCALAYYVTDLTTATAWYRQRQDVFYPGTHCADFEA
jgi:hypothetical protein